MEQTIAIFIELIKSELCDVALAPETIHCITPDILEEIYTISKSHDMTHIVAVALKKYGLLSDSKMAKKYMKSMHGALIRYEAFKHEQNRIAQAFEKENIVFVPLKGSVIRKYYPQRWMRTSCDIDVLVRAVDLERAKQVLVESLGYAVGRYKFHDLSLYAPSGILLELHFKILENDKKIDKNLEKVWHYVRPVGENRSQHMMTPEYLMFHVVAHMLYHFVHGGCGVRFVADIWLLEQKLNYDRVKFDALCRECKIETFVQYVRKLSRVWFEGEAHDSVTRGMESYILTGGVFGTVETKTKARKTKTKGQLKYLFQRICIPYEEFCASYPKMSKYPFLYPYYVVRRWFKIFNKQIAKNAVQEIKLNRNILQDDVDDLKHLFWELKI